MSISAAAIDRSPHPAGAVQVDDPTAAERKTQAGEASPAAAFGRLGRRTG